MNNREVAHLWANRSRQSAKGSHFYFEGDTIYSYGSHFPIARLFLHPVTQTWAVLFTSRDYSQTTSKHKSYTRSACSHLECFFVTDPRAQVESVADLERLTAEDAARRSRLADERREEKNASARRKRARAKAEREAQAAFPGELAAWRAGGPLPRLMNSHASPFRCSTALRLTVDRRFIETSRGAKVPACVARKAWPILFAAVAAEEANPAPFAWTPFLSLPEFNWGDYRGMALCRVALGSPVELVIGCHQIPWAEVALMAETLGLVSASGKAVSA